MNTLKKFTLPGKPKRKIITDSIDYYELFDLIELKFSNCYLFESLQLSRQQDRFVTLGFDPLFTVFAKGKTLTFVGKIEHLQMILPHCSEEKFVLHTENPYYTLRDFFPNNLISKTREGGLIGYFSYETVNYFEPSLSLEEDSTFGQFMLGFYTDGLIYDTTTGILEYYYYLEDRSSIIQEFVTKVCTDKKRKKAAKLERVTYLGDSSTREEYEKGILNSLDQIKKGNSFQTEVGFKTRYEVVGRKKIVYDTLRKVNPSPYMYYVKFDEKALFGASPEILVSSVNREVLTTPTAGTIKRGANEKEDQALARKLLTDPKENAEHNMLVDLHRNDLGRVCEIGSVRVRELMYVIKFSHVQHIVSDIVGILDSKYDTFDLLASILPGGVLTGAPKIETIKIIERNEMQPRGPYGGAAGRFSFNGDCTFCLPIRSLFCDGDQCFTQTSSGVVLDSTPEREYEEVKHKLEATRYTLEKLQK